MVIMHIKQYYTMFLRSHRENTSVTVSPSIAFNYVAFSPMKDSCFNDFGQTFAFEVTLQTLVILKKTWHPPKFNTTNGNACVVVRFR